MLISMLLLASVILQGIIVFQNAKLLNPKYEYTYQFVPDSVAQTIIDKVSENEWEVIATRRCTDGEGGVGSELMVKRRK
jgi:hypothetical protein